MHTHRFKTCRGVTAYFRNGVCIGGVKPLYNKFGQRTGYQAKLPGCVREFSTLPQAKQWLESQAL